MMKITGLSHLFKWENLHNWWLTKYFFAPLYIYLYIFFLYILFYFTLFYITCLYDICIINNHFNYQLCTEHYHHCYLQYIIMNANFYGGILVFLHCR